MIPRKAFSLVELLIIAAVVGILALAVTPVVQARRVAARTRDCLANARQIGQGLAQYAQDYDERLVPVAFYDRPKGHLFSWQELTAAYMPPGAAICPSSGHRDPSDRNYDMWLSYGVLPHTGACGRPGAPYRVADGPSTRGFGIEGALYQGWAGFSANPPDAALWGYRGSTPSATLASFRRPEATALVFESGMFDAWHGVFGCEQGIGHCARFEGLPFRRVGPQARHGEGEQGCSAPGFARGTLSVLYADGHARTIDNREFLQPRTLPDGRRVIDSLWPEE